jgi:hypothetical protein
MSKPKTFVTVLSLVLVVYAMPPPESSGAAATGNPSAPRDKGRFSAALESQISCGQGLDPAKAIAALQRAGMIQRRSYLNSDSLSYFRARRPLTVWGLKVVSVFGFAQNPRLFERGPGTAPPVTLGVVVPYPEAEVKSKLSSLGLRDVTVEPAAELDLIERRGRLPVLTEIYCAERYTR